MITILHIINEPTGSFSYLNTQCMISCWMRSIIVPQMEQGTSPDLSNIYRCNLLAEKLPGSKCKLQQVLVIPVRFLGESNLLETFPLPL